MPTNIQINDNKDTQSKNNEYISMDFKYFLQ